MAKRQVVSAVKMEDDFVVRSNHGDMFGFAGDFLVMGFHGELYRVAKAVFNDTYDLLPKTIEENYE